MGLLGNSLCVISASFPRLSQHYSSISESSETPLCRAQDLACDKLEKMRAVTSNKGSQPESSWMTY